MSAKKGSLLLRYEFCIRLCIHFPSKSMFHPAIDYSVRIAVNGNVLEGVLSIPHDPSAIVIFAHGNGVGRRALRNTSIAKVLHKAGFATLLIDLVSEDEVVVCDIRFNVQLLTGRLIKVIEWIWSSTETEGLPIVLFGTGAGAAAALRTAAILPDEIKAIVSRSGRLDLAEGILWRVACPTLLIVGSRDKGLIAINKKALKELHCEKKMEIIPGATHLFEEGSTLQTITVLVASWCHNHCCPIRPKNEESSLTPIPL